jgi:hypothetical protein
LRPDALERALAGADGEYRFHFAIIA